MHKDRKIIHLRVYGMHCIMCAKSVEMALSRFKGVQNVRVNYNSGYAFLEISEDTDLNEVIREIEKLGYKVSEETARKTPEKTTNIIRFISGLIFSILLMIAMHISDSSIYDGFLGVVIIVLSLLLSVFISYPVFLSALNNLKNLNLSVDVMYALGIFISASAAILGYAGILPYELITPETPVMLGSFLILGRFLEEHSRAEANLSIEKLLMTRPRKANRIITENGREEIQVIDSSLIQEGDILLIRASETIPADGEVISGTAFIDTSVITGEKRPVCAEKGSNVIAGTINLDGLLKIRANKAGEDTFLAKIINTALDASAKRTSTEKLADKLISYFLPIILLVAAAGGIAWYFYSAGDIRLAVS
ncbi:MAG: cation transporter, partial [Deltaproteobacteria bacterium]|nr:cation transporter [Deltaproteobacteria bacterium]